MLELKTTLRTIRDTMYIPKIILILIALLFYSYGKEDANEQIDKKGNGL